ncbi:TVP38/TMEM64 family protein [Enterococcus sp. AZ109]|uniref:TVP38/TMEM64 family protein n=1 Tax=Enterococcus sp. AZ109 TaxID=2774634 RepID=UPI003F20F344
MSIAQSRKLLNAISFTGLAFSVGLAVYFYHLGVFKDLNSLQGLVGQSVLIGPLIFVVIQMVQVIVPILPGGISLAAGVLIFGPFWGFIYNYVGICVGSIVLFLLGRHYGRPLISHLVSEKIFEKYSRWLENDKHFEKIFALAIFLPVAPDDALCLMASVTNISLKKYVTIILLAKPASIFLYSLALLHGGSWLASLLTH